MTISAAIQLGVAVLTAAEAKAVRLVGKGSADEGQQQLAVQALLKLTNLAGASYRAGDPHATAYAEGQRSVGLAFTMIATRSDAELVALGMVAKETPDAGSDPVAAADATAAAAGRVRSALRSAGGPAGNRKRRR